MTVTVTIEGRPAGKRGVEYRVRCDRCAAVVVLLSQGRRSGASLAPASWELRRSEEFTTQRSRALTTAQLHGEKYHPGDWQFAVDAPPAVRR